jgi:hypothetical protein
VRSGLLSIIFISLLFISYSCREQGGKNINQGEIHYNIEYSGNMGGVPKEVLPQNLVVSFKKNKLLFEMVSSFGNSGIINLTNPEDGIFDTYFSLFTIKYYYAAVEGELFPGFEAMEGMELTKTSKTAQICGFNCKNAEVTFPSDRSKVMTIWYTDEIDVKNSNISTPFKEIDGVLMDFYFYLGTTEVHFAAENVYEKDISDDTFIRRTDFKRVSREEINKFIAKMTSL